MTLEDWSRDSLRRFDEILRSDGRSEAHARSRALAFLRRGAARFDDASAPDDLLFFSTCVVFGAACRLTGTAPDRADWRAAVRDVAYGSVHRTTPLFRVLVPANSLRAYRSGLAHVLELAGRDQAKLDAAALGLAVQLSMRLLVWLAEEPATPGEDPARTAFRELVTQEDPRKRRRAVKPSRRG